MRTQYKPPSRTDDVLDDQPEVAETLTRLRHEIEAMLQRHERRLPPERQLAEAFGIGRATLRKALVVLERDGAVVRHVGRGTFITSGAGSTPPHLQALASGGALVIGDSLDVSPRELLEVRHALEPAIAELAALAARPADLEHMRECMCKREAASSVDDYEHWDYALHMSIAKATHNMVLVEMLDLVNRIRRSGSWRKFRGSSIKPMARHLSNTQHRAIVDAITRADPEGAFTAMREHLDMVTGRYRSCASLWRRNEVADEQ